MTPEEHARPHDTEESRRFLAEAEAALAADDTTAARSALETALANDGRNEELPLLLAMLDLREGAPGRAVERALEALAIRPFHPPAMNLLGVALVDLEQVELAEAVFRRAVAMAPGLAQAAKNLKDARRRKRGLRRAGGPRRPGTRDGDGLPRERIEALLRPGPPSLTACLIVTENAEVPRFERAALADGVDAIVVVDARSAGGGAPVAGDSRTIVRPYPDADDRAGAWNEALRHAAGDWVLLIEPGGQIDPASRSALRRALEVRGALYLAPEVRPAGSACGARRPVLLRNAPGLKLRGRVRPEPHASLQRLADAWGLRGGEPDVVVLAQGDPDPASADEGARALERLHRDLAEDPADHRARLERARRLLAAGEAERALQDAVQARRGLASGRRDPRAVDVEEAYTLEAYCLLQLERFEAIVDLLRPCHRAIRPTHNTLFLEGVARRAAGEADRAAELLERALHEDPRPGYAEPLPEVVGPVLPNMLGAAHLDRGDLRAAEQAFGRALERDPGNVDARLGLLGLRLAEGEVQKVLQELDRMVDEAGEDPRVWLTGGIVLGEIPALAAAGLRWMEEGRRRFPEHPGIRQRLGEAHLRCGEAEAALEAWAGDPPSVPAQLAARCAAALASGAELPAVAPRQRDDVGRELLGWFRSWMATGAVQSLDRALVDIARIEALLPGVGGLTAGWLDDIGQHEAAARILEQT